jgi:hypothetical protein
MSLVILGACGPGDGTLSPGLEPVAPGPNDPPANGGLRGVVSNDEHIGVVDAAIVIGTSPIGPATTFTDSVGGYVIAGFRLPTLGDGAGYVRATKDGYEPDIRFITRLSQDFHLYRLIRLTAGQSAAVRVASDDMPCVDDNVAAPLSERWVCRWVHIVVPTAGTLTVEARPTEVVDAKTGLWLFWPGTPTVPGTSACCDATTASIAVPAGAEATAAVLMRANAMSSYPFAVKTSLTKP